LLLPGALSKLGSWFAKHPHEEWVVGGSVIIGPEGEPKRDRLGNPCCNLGGHVTFNQLMFWGCGFHQPASFWRRSVFFEVGGFDRALTYCFDYDLFFGLSKRRPSGNIKTFIAAFRMHSESKTTNLYELKMKENKLLYWKYDRWHYSKLSQYMLKLWFEIRQKVAARYLQILLTLRLISFRL
jgi:hypothetical protein